MKIPIFDAHCDTLTAVHEHGGGLFENGFMVDFARLGRFSPAAQVFAVWNGEYEAKAALLKRGCAASGGRVRLCRSAAEVREANAVGSAAALISVEGAEGLGCDPGRLRRARERDGLAMLGLCWNYDNALCGAAMASGAGLTPLGLEFVRECQRIGVAVDLSHASERAFWDTLEAAEKPVLASHSDSASVRPCARNLSDGQFEALARAGGGAGINLCPYFLAEEGAGLADVLRHIERFLALGGERAVFLGADFDGIDETPEGLTGVQDMSNLYDALLRLNYPETLVRSIFYDNLLNILEAAQ